MNNLETIQSCKICTENSMKRKIAGVFKHTFKLCDKCNQSMEALYKETDKSLWDRPEADIHFVLPCVLGSR